LRFGHDPPGRREDFTAPDILGVIFYAGFPYGHDKELIFNRGGT